MKQFLRRWLQIPADTKTKIYELERLVLEINTRTRPKKPCIILTWSGDDLDSLCFNCGWELGYHEMGGKYSKDRFKDVA